MASSNGADEAALEKSYSVAPPVDVVTAEELLREAKRTMDQLGVVFFLRQGTCLGAIRDKGFIPWDDDVDLGSIIGLHGVTEKTIDTVASAFRDNGYFAKIGRNDHYVNVAMMKSSTRIDWACYRITGDSILHYPGVRIPVKLPAPLPAQALLHLRSESLHPAIDRRVVNRDAAFGHYRFEVAVADWVAAVPSYRPEHDLTLKMPSLEIVHAPTPRITQREQFTDHPNFATEPRQPCAATLASSVLR